MHSLRIVALSRRNTALVLIAAAAAAAGTIVTGVVRRLRLLNESSRRSSTAAEFALLSTRRNRPRIRICHEPRSAILLSSVNKRFLGWDRRKLTDKMRISKRWMYPCVSRLIILVMRTGLYFLLSQRDDLRRYDARRQSNTGINSALSQPAVCYGIVTVAAAVIRASGCIYPIIVSARSDNRVQ